MSKKKTTGYEFREEEAGPFSEVVKAMKVFRKSGEEVDDIREADYALFSTTMTPKEWEEKYGDVDIIYGTSDKEAKERVAKLKEHDYGKENRAKH